MTDFCSICFIFKEFCIYFLVVIVFCSLILPCFYSCFSDGIIFFLYDIFLNCHCAFDTFGGHFSLNFNNP